MHHLADKSHIQNIKKKTLFIVFIHRQILRDDMSKKSNTTAK